jgi:two-component system response regulator NreC
MTEGLAARMALERDMECVGRLESAADLSDAVRRLGAGVVLIDLEMPGPDPIEQIELLKRSNPEVQVVILSGYVRDHLIDRALAAGASGYFSKSDAPNAIFEGIRAAARGTQALGSDISEHMRTSTNGDGDSRSRLSSLTPRELQVLRLIGRGMCRADIARELFRSLKTIDAHHTSIMKKLDIHDRAELTRYAIQEGLVQV